MTPNDVMALIKEKGILAIDLRFIDLPGLWQHFTVSAKELDVDAFEDGVGFDGSSIRGFKQIQESDMLLFPDAATAFEDPFTKHPTLNMICNVKDPITGEAYSRDPRYVAQKAEAYLNSTGVADTAYFGPEPEFFILDDVRFSQGYDHGFYHVDAKEGFWNSGRDEQPNLGYKVRYKEGYFPVPPMDSHQDLRTEMMLELEKLGVAIEVHHHEVGTAGQTEIDMRFDSLVSMGDKLLKYKYVVKNVARRHNKVVTLMPKPIFQDNGSGMHVHQSLWKGGKNTFFEPGAHAGLSKTALYYIGGVLKHAPALLAFCNPTTNSYRPSSAWLRGADQPDLLVSEPERGGSDSGVLGKREGEADRGPVPRPDVQRLSGVQRAADGRARRHPEQDHAARTARQRPLRSTTRGDGQDREHAGESGGGTRRVGEGQRLPAEGRCVHLRPGGDLDRLQARRSRCDPPAPPSVGVRDVFRYLGCHFRRGYAPNPTRALAGARCPAPRPRGAHCRAPSLDGAAPRTPRERLRGPDAPRRARGARIVARPA